MKEGSTRRHFIILYNIVLKIKKLTGQTYENCTAKIKITIIMSHEAYSNVLGLSITTGMIYSARILQWINNAEIMIDDTIITQAEFLLFRQCLI